MHTNPDDSEQERHFVRMQVMSFLLHLPFRIPCCTNGLVEYQGEQPYYSVTAFSPVL